MDFIRICLLLMSINFICWNVRGIMSSAFPLSALINKYKVDVALITEHKLLPKSASFLSTLEPGFSNFRFATRSLYFNKMWEGWHCYHV